MSCGERFAFLLPPPCEGLVGLGWKCSGEDYEAGRERVDEIKRRLIRSWNEIMGLENAAGVWPVTERHRSAHESWLARYGDLSWEWVASSSDFEVLNNLAAEGVCLLDELVGDGEASYGDAVTVPAEPYKHPTKQEELNDGIMDLGRSAVTLAAIGVGLFAAYKIWERYG